LCRLSFKKMNNRRKQLHFCVKWCRHPSLPFQRFQALLTLFSGSFSSFPRYLFAIGLSLVFSFGWDLPPTLGCIPEQPDSEIKQIKCLFFKKILLPSLGGSKKDQCTGLSPSLAPRPRGSLSFKLPKPRQCLIWRGYNSGYHKLVFMRTRIPSLSSSHFARRYWGNPCWFLFLRLVICLSSAGNAAW